MGRREEVESRRRGKGRSVLIKHKLVFFFVTGVHKEEKEKKILVSIHLLGEWADARRRRRRRRRRKKRRHCLST